MTLHRVGSAVLVLLLVAQGCSSRSSSPIRDAEVIAEDGGGDTGLDASIDDASIDDASIDGETDASTVAPDADGSIVLDVPSVLVQAGIDTYRIDAVEVSQQRYAAFLGCSSLDACGDRLHAPCMHGEFDADATPDLPVRCVSPRSADVFCKLLGKRLCTLEELDPACDSTFARLTSDGHQIDQLGLCVVDATESGAVAVGAATECRGESAPFDAIFDVVGNVEEIATGCAGEACALGGSFTTGPHGSPCDGPRALGFDAKEAYNGFRCCDSAAPSE